MRERTYLDEIVENEYDRLKAFDGLVNYGKRIAERAFRHGVECDREVLQAILDSGRASALSGATWWTPAHVLSPGDVQPAPAEEKCSGHEFYTAPCGHAVSDRRREERRRGGNGKP